ncbi:MAG TPA: hypothetical protein VKY73_23220 [Polyangiaceae bacterium]|nr:hypothetical protein [Polyangiaceae bacterium]
MRGTALDCWVGALFDAATSSRAAESSSADPDGFRAALRTASAAERALRG